MNSFPIFSEYVQKARLLAVEAAIEIMKFYSNNIVYREKPDKSPLTDADEASDHIITTGLKKYFPKIPVISEESTDTNPKNSLVNIDSGLFWLVDPLDGTKEFIKKNGEFTVNIGLIRNRSPFIGVMYLPEKHICYVGENGLGAASWSDTGEINQIKARTIPISGPVVLASRSHINEKTKVWIKGIKPNNIIKSGSALKFSLLASGKADIYPRFSPTMEWDTAAGHAILEAAGGSIIQTNKKPLLYGKPGYLNPSFIAKGANFGKEST